METSQVSKTCEVWVVWLNLNLKSSLLFRMATRASTGRMPVLRRWAGAGAFGLLRAQFSPLTILFACCIIELGKTLREYHDGEAL